MKTAAIWARVSSPGQTSLPDQVARAREKLTEKGYIVPNDRILVVDWTSLDLFNCPEFLQLAGWVKRKEIAGLGVLDRDRLQAEPTQRLAFMSELQGAGVELVICQGLPMLDGDMGTLIEHVHAIAKKQQVLRAKLGARDGMHDKVTKDHRPTSKHRITGYRWVTDTRLEPSYPDYDIIKLIFDVALTGATDWDVQKALKRAGKLSPNGNPEWDRSTIAGIIHNPIYAGRYYANRHYVVKPTKRLTNSYGNSSARTRTLDEAVYLPEVEIVNSPITWEQRERILERRKQNQSLSKRNGHRDYLLRGFIKCHTHYGKKGEPRTYYGKPNGNSYLYTCPIGGCKHPNLDGSRIERAVKDEVRSLLDLQPEEIYRRIGDQGNAKQTRESLENELRSLETRYRANIAAETKLEDKDSRGLVQPGVYRELKDTYQRERIFIEERQRDIEGQLEQLDKQAQVANAWWEIRERVRGRYDQLTNAEWRELFIALNLEIHVNDHPFAERGKVLHYELGGGYPPLDEQLPADEVFSTGIDPEDKTQICFGLPASIERVSEIVSSRAYPSKHNHQLYPLRVTLRDFVPIGVRR